MLFKFTFLSLFCLTLSGCAGMKWYQNEQGEYDFFLEDKTGEKIEPTEEEKAKVKGGKEARLKAKAALQQGDTDTALVYFVKALEFDEEDEEALNGIADIHFVRGNNELAILAYRMILADNPENLDAKQGLGLALIKANKYEDARLILLSSLKDNPQRTKIYNGLGVISDLQRYYEEARWFYANGLMIDENSAILMTNLGYSYYLENKWENAEKIYKRVLTSHPKHIQAHLNLALLQARKGELYDSLSSFEQVLSKPQSYNELGYIMMLDKKYTMAEQLFQKAISASPSYFDKAHKNLEQLKELQIKRKSKVTSISLQ